VRPFTKLYFITQKPGNENKLVRAAAIFVETAKWSLLQSAPDCPIKLSVRLPTGGIGGINSPSPFLLILL
jgi:hypothetical protein